MTDLGSPATPDLRIDYLRQAEARSYRITGSIAFDRASAYEDTP